MPSTGSSVATPGLHTRARASDPDTSKLAAAGISERALTVLKQNIVRILTDLGPLTDEGIYDEYVRRGCPRRTAQRVRTARHELTTQDQPWLTAVTSNVSRSRLQSGYLGQLWTVHPSRAQAVAA